MFGGKLQNINFKPQHFMIQPQQFGDNHKTKLLTKRSVKHRKLSTITNSLHYLDEKVT